ncbi:unnamed protein product [Linum trigynum]|uniref:Uncharacterized protein n=1 Tax=Linum trigynum TaxID=586398 RepID=A0AAV2FIM7_9ROSI
MSLSPSGLLRYARRRKSTIPEVEDSKVLRPSQLQAAAAAVGVSHSVSGCVHSEPMEETEENLQESSDTNPTDHSAGNLGVVVRESEAECLVDSAFGREMISESDKLVDSDGLPVTEDMAGASKSVVDAVETGNPQDEQPQMDLDLRGLVSCERKAPFDLSNDLQMDPECGDGYLENIGKKVEVLESQCHVVSNLVVIESGNLSVGGASGDSQRSSMESLCHESHVTQVELITANASSQPHDERLMDVDSKGAESSPHCERNAPFDQNDSLQKDAEIGIENSAPKVEVLDPESECNDVSTPVVTEGVQESRKLSDGASGDSQRSSMESPFVESHVTQPEASASPSEGLHSDNIGTASVVEPHDERPMEVVQKGAGSSHLCERNAPLNLNDTVKKGDECVDGHNKNLGVGAEVSKPGSHVVSTMVAAEGVPESRSDRTSGDLRRSSSESAFAESLVTQSEVRASQSDSLHSDNIGIASTGQPPDERHMDLDSRGAENSPHFGRNILVGLSGFFQKGDECGDGYSKNVGAEIEVSKSKCHVVSTMVVADGFPQSIQLTDGGASGGSQRASAESPCHESLVPQPEVRASNSEGLYSATIGTASTGQPHGEPLVDVNLSGADDIPHCGRNIPLDLNNSIKKGDDCGNGHNEKLGAQVEVLEPECHNVSIMVAEQRVPESRKLSGGSSNSQRSSVGSLCHESHGTLPEARDSKFEGLHSATIATAISSQPHDQRPIVLDAGAAEYDPHCKRNVSVDMNEFLQKDDGCGDGYNENLRVHIGVLEPQCRDVSTKPVAEGVQESRKLSYGSSGDSQRSSMDSPCHESHVTQPEVRASHSEVQPQDWPKGADSEAVRSSPHCNQRCPDANNSSKKEDQCRDDYYDNVGAPIHVSGTGKEIPLPRVPHHFMGMKDGNPCRLPIGNHLEEDIDDLPPGVQRGPRDYLRGVWDYARKAAHQARVNSLEASVAQKRVRELESQVQSLNQLMEDWKHKALGFMERSRCFGSSLAPIHVLPVTGTGLPDAEPCHRLPLAATSTGAVFTPKENPLVEGIRTTPPSGPGVSMGFTPTGRLIAWAPERCSSSASPTAMNNDTYPSSIQHLSISTDAIKTCTLPPTGGVLGSSANCVQKPRHVRRVRFEGLDDGDGNVRPFHVPKKRRTHDYSSRKEEAPTLHKTSDG